MKRLVFSLLLIVFCMVGYSQNHPHSETKKDTTQLEEVVISTRRKLSNNRQEKTLSSIDNFLEKSNNITMIKRGNYAWEPAMNNMVSDRLVVTIDGMQIFGACTDKMDPVTSYVDVSNLEKVIIGSGQTGTENGHCVGGGIDLKLPTSQFTGTGLRTSTDLGYETNGNYFATGLDLEYSGEEFFISVDGIFRKSDNYTAGGDQEVLFSQFQKYNISLQSGYKLNEVHQFDTNIIYDRATDVGYPALPMDVSLAEALITSLTHYYYPEESELKSIESKLYFNTITHIMDDSKRPDVPIRMDMPGWSDTFGFYSKADVLKSLHHLSFDLNSFYNRSLAEMTMFSNNPEEPDMFMLTWPDIRTFYTGVFAKDDWHISNESILSTTLRLGYQINRIADPTGVESLRIFHPDVDDQQNRFLISLSSAYTLKKEKNTLTLGIGYGERAPSVSEGYGFFIFNSFDNYDYIGNPNLKNEKAFEANVNYVRRFEDLSIGLESSAFFIKDYIIGEIAPDISSMTIGANGVRVYEALNHATIFDIYLNSSYKISNHFSANATIGYNYGQGSNGENLPLIRPFSYIAELNYTKPKFNVAIQIEGNGNQSNFSSFYGENETPAYTILNLNAGNALYGNFGRLFIKYGIENILDKNYSTFADWNNIPRPGRNFYLNLSYLFP
jgi:iron complex outermembrane receptor protein